MYDFVFVFTEQSDNEGEDFLIEAASLEQAKTILEIDGLKSNEYRLVAQMKAES